MTRNWELLRYILSAVQACEAGKSMALADVITSRMLEQSHVDFLAQC